jgi:hypothetical protein
MKYKKIFFEANTDKLKNQIWFRQNLIIPKK